MKDKKYYKVRDHCQCTGEYRRFAHSIYNLKYSVPGAPKKMLCFFIMGLAMIIILSWKS